MRVVISLECERVNANAMTPPFGLCEVTSPREPTDDVGVASCALCKIDRDAISASSNLSMKPEHAPGPLPHPFYSLRQLSFLNPAVILQDIVQPEPPGASETILCARRSTI